LGVPKTREIKKVTTSQDDGFVGGLEIQLIGYPENTKGSKKFTGSQDDKGEGCGSMKVVDGTETFFIALGGPQPMAHPK
jgi:hypothetical protein